MTYPIGVFKGKLDERKRIVVPAEFREFRKKFSKGELMIRKDIYRKCLILSSMKEWQEELNNIKDRPTLYPLGHYEKFMDNSRKVTLDRRFRVLIPKGLLDDIEIKEEKEIFIKGNEKVIEFWKEVNN